MNEETLAMKFFVALAAEAHGWPGDVAERDASRWIAGVRDHRISDFTAVNMLACRNMASGFKQDMGL
tara:strand:- start:82 stop:282 length:201 start_codon:yes stop_codon:yes gene_type:complete